MKQLLGPAAGKLAQATGSTAAVVVLWADLVGEAISRNAQPHSLVGGVLLIQTRTAQWQRELSSREAELRSQLNDALGSAVVRRLEFKVTPQ